MLRFLALMLVLALCAPATADDWSVDRTRGQALQQIDGLWVLLARGDVVPDNRLLQTGSDGRVGLRRGAESIEMGGDTQIRIHDAGDAMMTTVLQDYGTVAVEAERRNVQHFSVQTPFLAAVVKGTRFTVTFNDGVAHVSVERGTVQVQDQLHSLVTDIIRGHDATVSQDEPLAVTGPGATPIYAFEGQTALAIVTPAENTDDSDNGNHGDDNASGAGNGNNGNGNADDAENGNGNNGNGNADHSDNGNHGDGNANGAGNGNDGNGNGNADDAGNGNGNNGNGNADHNDNGNHDQGNADGAEDGNSGNHGNSNTEDDDSENADDAEHGNSGEHGSNKD